MHRHKNKAAQEKLMTMNTDNATYTPEYATLELVECGWFGRAPERCAECGAWGETESNIALDRGNEYALYRVWGCRECQHYWRTRHRPLLNLFRYTTDKPGFHGHEVVGTE